MGEYNLENRGFFDRLFDGEVNWGFHTTMTCDLLYSIQLAYKLVGKDIYKDKLTKDEMDRTAIFYNKDPKKGRVLGCKGSGRKKKLKDYLCLNHAVCSSEQTFHAKISLVSYKKSKNDTEDKYRIAVYSKNCEFNDECAEAAIILNLKVTKQETESGKNLVDYIEHLYNNLNDKDMDESSKNRAVYQNREDEERSVDINSGVKDDSVERKKLLGFSGKKWIEENIKKVYDTLKRCEFVTEFDEGAELYFGGIPLKKQNSYTVLNNKLQLQAASLESMVLTPPEFIRGTDAQKFFEGNCNETNINELKKPILYDLKKCKDAAISSSHIKLYLLEKSGLNLAHSSEEGKTLYELWIGSANATVHGLGWSFSNSKSFKGAPSVECLVKIQINKDKFDEIKSQITEAGYYKFVDFTKKGSLPKFKPDDFGPWICENMEVEDIKYYDSAGKPVGKDFRGKTKKICVKLKYKSTIKQTIPYFKGKMCWRPAEYPELKDCIISTNFFELEYETKGFRPSQGVLCFGTNQSMMVIDKNKMANIPQVEEIKEMDVRVSGLLLSKDFTIGEDELDDTPNDGINWFYEITKPKERKLPCIKCAESELKTKPMDFQDKAAKRLQNILGDYDRAFLADEPGLGKTYSATKLICEMADTKKGEPFYVIYVAPNQSLLQKNGEEIISKANEGLLKDGWEIHMLNEYMSNKSALLSAYKRYIDYMKISKETITESELKWLESISAISECKDKKIKFEEIAQVVGKVNNCDSQILINAYNNCDNPGQNLHKIFYTAGIIEECNKGKINRKKITKEYVHAYKKIKRCKLIEEKDLYIKTLNSIFEELERKEENAFSTYSFRRSISREVDIQCVKNGIKKMDWNIINSYYKEIAFPDRLAYAYKVIDDNEGALIGKKIILITVSQGCLFGDKAKTDLEGKIIKAAKGKYGSDFSENRAGFTKWFLEKYKPDLIIWDEYHRYLTNLNNNSEFLKAGMKNLFVSATPYKTNISGCENKEIIEQLYNIADDKEADEYTNLPSFEDFAKLFCENDIGKESEKLKNAYNNFTNNPNNKEEFETLMRTKMVRHERSRLQGEHEIHIRKYPAVDNVGETFRIPFLNTLNQSRLLEKSGYLEGARKWSLSLPWILAFSTKDRRVTKEIKGITKSNYYSYLEPKKNPSDELFVYEDDGTVKRSIHTLPVQNLAFYQICKENAYDRMCQLLWIPPTAPLYSVGNDSIFSIYASYSKLLVFAEYRYLQRGGSRLLSDYVQYENMVHVKQVPQGFPVPLKWSERINEIEKFNLVLEDYRDSIRGMYFDVNELPGPIITKEEELADTMKNAINNFVYDDKYKAFNEKFNKLEDGQAAKRLVDIVFKA